MSYSIGYDIGSSSIKVALIDTNTGKAIEVVKEPETEMNIKAVKSGWAEQDPNLWWKNACIATKKLLTKTNIDSKNISTVGISYQMHGLVLLDKNGGVLRDAIIWCDSRAVEIGKKAFSDLGNEKCAETLLNSPGNFTASKLKWVQLNEPDIYKKVSSFMLPGDFIAYKLTDKIFTTPSGLSEGMLWDFQKNSPSDILLEHYDISKTKIPEICDTFSDQGYITPKASIVTGLSIKTKVTYRAGDQPNNALTLGVLSKGQIAATGGTSGVVYAVSDTKKTNELERINNFAHVNYLKSSPKIGKLLCINGCGILYNWLRSNLNVQSYDDMNTLAETVPIGSEGVIILPFGNGAERMLNNINRNAHIKNINFNVHTKAHLCRAAIEGIAFSFFYGVTIMKEDFFTNEAFRAGADNLFQSKIFSETLATLLQCPIEIYNTTGAVGAARASYLSIDKLYTIEKYLKADYIKTFIPIDNGDDYMKAYISWQKGLLVNLIN